ncbi:MAG: hypothetical protein COA79_09605 [Planctomycetota bacterium]|nr:MAG: hypothetical protein COA79_09605 [Planctomycetota bacterium]
MKIIFTLCALVLTFQLNFAKELPNVIVSKFKNSSGFRMQTTDSITDSFISILMKTKRFSVFERERLKDINEEMLRKGKIQIKGADFAFLNNISTFDIKISSKKIPFIKLKRESATIKVQVNVRVVDLKTSKVVFSALGKAEQTKKATKGLLGVRNSRTAYDNSLVNDVMIEALENLVINIVDNMFPVKVVMVKKEVVFLNRGKPAGVNIGDIFIVYKKGEKLIDPDTGINLGSEDKEVARVEVTETLDKFSKAKIVGGSLNADSRGMECRKPVVVDSKKKKKRK